MGYHQAGFNDVLGVDIHPQPNYPFKFVQGDALDFLAQFGGQAELIHASPPCQTFSQTRHLPNTKDREPPPIAALRNMLRETGRPYIIENVPGAPLENHVMLCGTMFGLPLIRHRWFECWPEIVFSPAACRCKHLTTASHRQRSSFSNGATAICVTGHNFINEDGKIAMGINWMTRNELAQAIPPAYTRWLGKKMIEHLENAK